MTPITATHDFVRFAPRFSFSRLREKVPKGDEGALDPASPIATLTRPFGPPSPAGRGEK